MNIQISFNRFPVELKLEYWDTETKEWGEELVIGHVYADGNPFKVRNEVIERWEALNPTKELTDYEQTNSAMMNDWFKQELGK